MEGVHVPVIGGLLVDDVGNVGEAAPLQIVGIVAKVGITGGVNVV